MEVQDLEQTVINTVADQLRIDPARIRPDASFQRDLGVDSVDFMELVMLLEEQSGVLLADESLPALRTVSDLIEALELARTNPSGELLRAGLPGTPTGPGSPP